MQHIYDTLDALGIEYEKYEHEAMFTVEQADAIGADIHGVKTKNLFLRDRKGSRHFLVIAEAHAQVDLKKIAGLVGEAKLGFASPERLKKYLGVEPGSVSLFALVNDSDGSVEVLIDKTLLNADKIGFHPNVNTETVVVRTKDIDTFLAHTGHSYTTFQA